LRVICRTVCVGVALLGLTGLPTTACDSPVYEYALYQWQARPYSVLYLAQGTEDPTDKDANAFLDAAGHAPRGHANLRFVRPGRAGTAGRPARGLASRR